MISRALRERLLCFLASPLPEDERTIVLGDLQEEDADLFSSMAEIVGYAVRREFVSWTRWESWLVLIAVTAPLTVMLGSASLSIADGSAIYVWSFASNWDIPLLHQVGFWTGLRESIPAVARSALALVCWAWCCGALIGAVSRKTLRVTGLLICLFFATLWAGWRPPTVDLQPLHLARDLGGNAAAFRSYFYRDYFSPLVQLLFVVVPMLCGLKDARPQMLRGAWTQRAFWVLVGVSLVTLAAHSSAWWQVHTWTTLPAPTPHLPSLISLAVSGGLAWLIVRRTYIRGSKKTRLETS